MADALRRTGGIAEPVVELGGGVEATGYRTTVRVAATADGRAGFRAEQTHDVVEAPNCLVAHPTLAALLPELRLDPGVEPTLRVSVATGELAARWDQATGEVHGLPAGTATGSRATLHEDVAGHRLRVSMGSFFQSGPQAAELLVDTVRQAAPELDGARLVVDAYAGVGMFAVCVTDPATRVIAIETSRSALGDAAHNLADRDAEIVRGEVGGWQRRGGLGRRRRRSPIRRAAGSASPVSTRSPARTPRCSCSSAATRRRSAATHGCSPRPAIATSVRRWSTRSRTRPTSRSSPASSATGRES